MLRPCAVAITWLKMFTDRLAALNENLPGTLNADSRLDGSLIAASALNTSTCTSNVPLTPVNVALMPPAPPNANPALSAPSAIVSVSLPSLNEVPARAIDGPCRNTGELVAPAETSELVLDMSVALVTVKLANPCGATI